MKRGEQWNDKDSSFSRILRTSSVSVGATVVLLAIASGCTTARQSTTKPEIKQQTYALPEGLHAEAQYRPGVDPSQYPLIEVYLQNRTSKQVEWKQASLNGEQLQMLTNGVVWYQFYPSERADPGETVLLQINLVANPRKEQTVECGTRDGQRVKTIIPAFSIPPVRIDGVTFGWDFRKVFVAYSPQSYFDCSQLVPARVTVNGTELSRASYLMSEPALEQPAMLRVALPGPTKQGCPVHLRLEFKNGIVRQCLLRAHKGVFLDAFGVAESDRKLRTQLGLDLRPFGRFSGGDPACTDLELGRKYGASMPTLLATRKTWWEESDDRLSYVSLCTAATPNAAYSIYGQCMDATEANPYRLHWSQDARFVETEERYLRWARQAAAPRPWFWFPEAWEVNRRILEPEELRLLTCAAIGLGVKGINYFTYSYRGSKPVTGFDQSPRLLAEIKTLNRMLKKYERVFSAAIPISEATIGADGNSVRVHTLWSGEEGVLVAVRRTDYTTDREPNELGSRPRFRYGPPETTHVRIIKPRWMKVRPSPSEFITVNAIDLMTGKHIRCKMNARDIWFDVHLDLGKLIFIPS